MLKPNQTLDLAPVGMVFHIMKTAAETNGQSLEMEWDLLPKAGGTPVHIHPAAREEYQVLQGQLEVYMDGEWKRLQAGEHLTVPAGRPHTFRNPTDQVTRVYNTHAPAMQFEGYFEGLSRIVTRLSPDGKEKLKMSLKAAVYLSMLMKQYPAEIISVNPPNLVVSLLNGIGKLIGLKMQSHYETQN